MPFSIPTILLVLKWYLYLLILFILPSYVHIRTKWVKTPVTTLAILHMAAHILYLVARPGFPSCTPLICKTKEITHTTKEPVGGISDKVKWAGERAPMLRVPAALRIHDWLPAPTCGSSQLSVTSSYWGAHNSGPCRQCVQGHAYTCTRTKFKSRSFYKGSPYPCLNMSHYREKKGDQAGKCTQTLNAVRIEI